jgi:hypothetical protein
VVEDFEHFAFDQPLENAKAQFVAALQAFRAWQPKDSALG